MWNDKLPTYDLYFSTSRYEIHKIFTFGIQLKFYAKFGPKPIVVCLMTNDYDFCVDAFWKMEKFIVFSEIEFGVPFELKLVLFPLGSINQLK